MASPEDLERIWSAFGLNPQAFPIYYPMGPQPFLGADAQPSGAAGAIARLTRDLSNFPHMFIGLRIDNTYSLPTTPTADQVQLFRALKEWVDDEQTVRIDLAQQNITAPELFQRQLTGRGGVHWHPFPVPFPMAGANTVQVVLTRVTGYPQIVPQEDLTPVAFVAIIAAVLRADLKTIAPHRMPGGGGR